MNKDSNISFLLIFGTSLQLIFKLFIPISLSADSYQYIELVYQLPFFADIQGRTIGYPLFLLLLGTKSFLGVTLVIAVQSFLAILGPVLIYLTFRKFNSSIVFVISILLNILFFHHWVSHQIMTECLLAFVCCAIVYFVFKFFNKINIKNLLILFAVILAGSLIRQTIIYIGYFFIFFFIIYILLNFSKNNLKILVICLLSIFSIVQIKSVFEPKFVSHNFWFYNWYWISTALCQPPSINDTKELNNCPEGSQYYSSDKYNFNEGNEKYANKCATKCFNINNGKMSEAYFSIVTDALENDDYFLKVLSSNYDYKDAPDDLNPLLINKTPREILEYQHREETSKRAPFIHVYFNLTNHYPYDFLKKILRGAILETFISYPELFMIRLKYILKNLYDFKPTLKKGLNDGMREINYWSFTPKPNSSLEDQGFSLLYKLSPTIYAQFNHSMERLHGKEIDKLYSVDLKPVEYFDEFYNSYKIKFDKFINNKSVSMFFAHNFLMPQQYVFSLYKILIYILFPIFAALIFLIFLFDSFKNKRIIIPIYFYPLIIVTFSGYLITTASFWISYQQRHLDMHAPLMLPSFFFMLFFLYLKIKKNSNN